MKTILHHICLVLLTAFIISCTPKPKPIAYGAANCAHCNMTVADNRYGAELVNDKGKLYFFDSSECLMAYVTEQPELGEKAAYLMVTDYTRPNELIDARSANFLQAKALPSPMGMYMTAVADKEVVAKMKQTHGGRLLTWEEAVIAVKNNERPE